MGMKVAARLLLALLLGATGWLALTAAPLRIPSPGGETTLWLAAHSLAVDGDDLFVDADAARFRARFGEGPRDVRTERWETGEGGTTRSDRLAAPYLASRLWSAALAVAGERGPFLLNVLALLAAAVAGTLALGRTLGPLAPLWVSLFLFGSVAFTYVFRWQSEILVFTAVVVAGALVWGREGRSAVAHGADQIYGGDLEARAALWPWPLAGLLLGAAAVRHPAYALLAVPMLLDLPREPRRRGTLLAGALFLVAMLLPVAYVLAAYGAPWETPVPLFHGALAGWNALYFFAGRHAGLLVGFLPVLALLLSPRQDGGRRFLPLVVLVASLAQLAAYPFDWAEDLSSVGNAWFLPLYGALWFGAGPTLRARGALLVSVAAVPFLAPFWIAPLGDGTRAPASISSFTTGIRERLPFETSLRSLPGSFEIARAGVRLRGTGPTIRPAGARLAWEGDGSARRGGERRAALLVESDRALSSVRLDFAENAPATLAVEGGTAGSTTFRPNGEVAFDITLGSPARRHPLWWSRTPVSIYFLRLALPDARVSSADGAPLGRPGTEPITFDLGLARVAGTGAVRP